MLKEVKIKNFKNIESLVLKLKRINLLVGGNNSGKTSILQAIQFSVAVAQTIKLQDVKWRKEGLVKRSILPTELVYSPLREVSALVRGGELKQGEKYTMTMQLNDEELGTTYISVARGKNINVLATLQGKAFGETLQSMENPYSILVPGLAGIPYFEEFKSESIVRKAAARGDANNVFRNVLWLLRNDKAGWEKFVQHLEIIFPGTGINVNFNDKVDDNIKVTIKTSNSELPIDAVGTGVLQAIQILSYVNVYRPQLLILDEPDSHLHPDNQRKILRMLVSIAEEENIQVIISTHSRHIIDEIGRYQSNSKINWIKDGKIVEEDEFDIIKVFMEIGALDKGDLLRNGSIKCVILTEDSTEPEMLKAILEASGFLISEVDIWPYCGCTKIDTATVLSAFIKKHAPAVKIILHRDRDYLTDDEANDFKNKINRLGIECFLTKGTDIESHFLDIRHIMKVCSLTDSKICEDLINKSTVERKDISVEKFINSRTLIELDKSRKNGDGKINNGRISLKCLELYNDNTSRYRHGKAVYKALKNNIQIQIKGKHNLIQNTEYLLVDELKNIAETIWKTERRINEIKRLCNILSEINKNKIKRLCNSLSEINKNEIRVLCNILRQCILKIDSPNR